MKRKICLCITIFVLILSFSTNCLCATQKELQNKQKELKEEKKEVTQEKKEAKTDVQNISAKINDLDTEIEDIKTEIQNISNEISSKEKMINSTKKDIEDKEELLEKRLVAMYKSGDTNYLDFILSGNFIDYMSNYYLVNQIAEYDTGLIDDVINKKDEIEEDKKVLEEKKEKLLNKKKELSSKTSELENQKSAKEKLVSNLTDEEKKLQKQIDEYYAQERALEASIRAAEQSASNSSLVFSGNGFTWPCPYTHNITSYFGNREQPIPGASTYHQGIDIAASGINGKPIVAASSGEVISAGWNSYGGGNVVMIYHGSGISTVYMHCSAILVSKGQSVSAGQTIAKVGSTGNSSGPHLHFGVKVNGQYKNPLNYF